MNKIEIEIPVGKEVDWEASARQKQIILKDKQLTYENVCKELFKKEHHFTDVNGGLCYTRESPNACPNNASTKHQLECILAKNMLANVAVYLNNGWRPNVEIECGYCIALDCYHDLAINHCGVLCEYSSGKIVFKSKELAQQAIEILGEKTVKLALKPLY